MPSYIKKTNALETPLKGAGRWGQSQALSILGRVSFMMLVVVQTACVPDSDSDDREQVVPELVALAEGTLPVGGAGGSKRINIIDDADQLAEVWSDYSTADLPSVDFTDQTVMLVDQGTFGSSCSGSIYLQGIEKSDTDEGLTEVILHEVKAQSCDTACTSQVVQPFAIVALQTRKPIIVSERVTLQSCD